MKMFSKVTASQIRAEKAKRRFKLFIEETKPDYVFRWYHDQLIEKIEAFERGDITHLMIFLPPQHGKSEIVSRRAPAWFLGRNPDLRIAATSYGSDLASRINRDVQRIIDSERYQQIFPETTLDGSNVRTVADEKALRNSDMFEVVGHAGSFKSSGINSPLTGMPVDVLIIDDPIKDQKEADSITYRNAVWEWYGSVAETRLNANGKVLLLQTRWHEDDLAGRLLALAKSDPTAQQWEVLELPAIKEDDLNPNDPRVIGEALWPDRFPASLLHKRKRNIGTRRFSALYQQRPTPAEGSIIKRAWCTKFYKTLPAKLTDWLISADFTFKDTATADFVVIQVWAKLGAEKYLISETRDRMDFPTTLATFKGVCRAYPQAFVKLIEDKANGPAVISSVKKEIPGVIPVNPQGSKDERLSSVSPDFEAGNVLLPHPDIAPWIHDWIEELCTKGAHDDRKDACSQALQRYRGPASSDFPEDKDSDSVETISGGIGEGNQRW